MSGTGMHQLRLVVRHELVLLFKNRRLLFSNLFGVGLILTFLLASIRRGAGSELTPLFLILLFAVAGGTPLTLAVHAFVGEKERRTLEPLLLMPVRMVTLIGGKLLATWLIVLAELAATWAVALAGMRILGRPDQYGLLVNGVTVYAGVVLAPLFTLLFSLVAIIISGRSTDTQSASSLNVVVASPVVALLFAVWFGWIAVDRRALVLGTYALLVLGMVVLRAALAVLHAEALLRRRG